MSHINNLYNYRPLQPPYDIRIIKLLPGALNDPLACEIQHVPLNHKTPPYEALSYECEPAGLAVQWMNRPKPSIKIGPNSRLPITPALSNALRALRLPRDPRVLWADAICVNQSESGRAEKEKQISKVFASIYTSASRVVTYIGEEEPDTVFGLRLAAQILDYVEKTLYSEPDMAVCTAEHAAMRYFNFPPDNHPAWRGLRSLIERGWSSRTWIVQESLLNQNMIMYCGRKQIPWDTFPRIVQYAKQMRVPMLALFPRETFEMPHSAAAMWNHASAATNLLALSQLRSSMIYGGETKTLLELLEELARFDATNKHDKIFSVLSMASDAELLDIDVDYQILKEDLFTNVTKSIIEVSESLDVLSNVKPRSPASSLPSWVPDWSPIVGDPVVGLLYGLEDSTNRLFSASGQSSAHITFDPHYLSITLRARVLDTITYSSRVIKERIAPVGPAGEEQLAEGRNLLDNWYAKVQRSNIYGGQKAAHQAFWRTLIGNLTHERKAARNEYERNFRAWRSEIWPHSYDSYEDVDFAEGAFYGFALQATLKPRCFCMSAKGYACLTPAGTRTQDQICLLEGGRTPYVIRRVNEQYTLVGEAYVHGLMRGEGTSMPGTRWEHITLC